MNLLKSHTSWNGVLSWVQIWLCLLLCHNPKSHSWLFSKSTQCPRMDCFLDWGLEGKWPTVSASVMELESDQAKKVGQVMLPNYLEEIEAFFFSQWVVFGSLMMCLCPILRSRGRVNFGQASHTSKAQVSCQMWMSIDEMFESLNSDMLKFQLE